MDERRQDPRSRIIFRSEFASGDRMPRQGIIQDVSIRGCRVKASGPVQVNETFRMQLFLPQCSAPIQIDEARVRWAGPEEFGCQFLTIRPEERARLRDLLAGIKPA